jgi:CspA family cold shock protein
MRLISQLILCLVIAGTATFCVLQWQLDSPLQLGTVIAIAACLPTLLASLARRGGTDHSEEDYSDREEGEVKWFNVSKGFGFIRRENGEEIFVHFRSIEGDARKVKGRRALNDGQRVSFVVVDSDKGPQAEHVHPL